MSEGRSIRIAALLCAFALLASPSAFGQTAVSFPDNPRFAVQRLADQFGLGAVTVTAMGQDAQGFLWIGTQTGLYRFDGTTARKMTDVERIIGHYVEDLVIAPDGTAWFAGNRGIAHYTEEEFKALEIPAAAMPLGTGAQLFAVDSTGMVYVARFGHGVVRVDAHHPSDATVLADKDGIDGSVAGITRAQDDSIWFTFGAHLGHLRAGSSAVETDRGIRIPKDRVVALTWDGGQRLWLRTATGLARLDVAGHKLLPEKAVQGTADDVEGKPSLDVIGRLLVPSSSGLYWQNEDGQWRVITDKQGISSNDIQFALEDREGTLWIGGSGTGLDRLPGVREWSGWTTSEGLPDNSTWATQRDSRGRLWVTTSRGIGVWNPVGHRWERITLPGKSSHIQVRQLQVAGDGAMWGVTVTGAVARIDPENFSATMFWGYHGDPYQVLRVSPTGEIWAETRDHLVKFMPPGPGAEPMEEPLPLAEGAQLLNLAFSPEGTLWATGTGVVFRLDGYNWTTLREGLMGRTITSVTALSKKEAWVGYNDVVGVTRIVLDSWNKPKFENHLWDWNIVGQDSKGRVWFNGPDGLNVLPRNAAVLHLSHVDGLLWDDVSPWTGVREERDGSYMVATSRGLSRYKPTGEAAAGKRTIAAITSVEIGGKGRKTNEVAAVQPGEGAVTIHFSPLVLDSPESVSCVYQLRGLDQQVTETKLREVNYGGLPAGNYQFWVQCQVPDSRMAAAPAVFRFRVLPSVWQTWWARLGAGLALLGCFWGYVRLRTRSLNGRRVELERAVAQRSAELVQKNKELEQISLTDPLTGTRNRRYFYETISTDIAQAQRSHLKNIRDGEPVCSAQELIFVLVDIDRFKHVNDEMGHAAGDRLLQEMAKRIGSVMRRTDDLVRWGGEEFLLVCRTTDRENASLLCSRVLEAVRDLPFDVENGVEIHKTCSIGWAPFPWLKDDVKLLSIENVLELADRALYLAKREGRNRAYGLLPVENVYRSEKTVSMENLRACPPDLVQIV